MYKQSYIVSHVLKKIEKHGGKARRKRERGLENKKPVLALVGRNGNVRPFPVDNSFGVTLISDYD